LLQGCIFAATDRSDQATPLIASGVSAMAATQMTLFAPLGYTWLARTLAACGRLAEAQDALSKALNAVSKTNERWDEARELLAPVFSWFTEGFEMSDLREAKALLEA
jgi:hypothetical protein